MAAVQAPPVFLDLDASVDRALDLIAEAAAAGAEIIAFPETWLPGYPAWIFGAAAWDHAGAKRAYARLLENAVTVPGDAVAKLCRAAAAHAVQVVMGANERDVRFSRGSLYNSLLFIASDGTLAGVHRKLMPTHAERIVWAPGDGSTLTVVETPDARIGGLVCWEHWMPLARFAMHALGEQVHVAAWPEGSHVTELASLSYAFEGRCYVIAASPWMTRTDIPADFELSETIDAAFGLNSADDVVNSGGSGIAGPDGRWIAGPVYGRPEIVCATIDLDRIAEEQQVLDAAGHYNRPDVFRVSIDTRPKPAVRWLTDDDQHADSRERAADQPRTPDEQTTDQ